MQAVGDLGRNKGDPFRHQPYLLLGIPGDRRLKHDGFPRPGTITGFFCSF